MPYVITAASVIKCAHQGTVTPVPSQTKLKADGNVALVMGDVMGATVAGCTVVATSSTKPCLTVVSMLVGTASKLKVDGKPVLLDTANGITDGVPPGTWTVQSAGQTKLRSV